MQTREKLGGHAKRLLKSFFESREPVNSYKLLLQCKDLFQNDYKKLIELIFVLEGLGFITRISKKKFIYTGFTGMLSRIIEITYYNVLKIPVDRDNWLFSDEFLLEGRKHSIRYPVFLGQFYQELLGIIFTQTTRTINRDAIEKLIDSMAVQFQFKEVNAAQLFNEMASIMTSLNLLDKRSQPDAKQDSYEIYQWIGPEICLTVQLESYNPYNINLREDIAKINRLSQDKENGFIVNLLKDLDENIKSTQSLDLPKRFNYQNYPTVAYALLKGKNILCYMKKLSIIIGRQNSARISKYMWEVDLALDMGAKVSKQHAQIYYNQESECFEIKCLSSKKTVTVDQMVLTSKSNPYQMKNRSIIQISRHQFVFYLPKQLNQGQSTEQIEQEQI